MKKVLSIVIAGVAVFALSGCATGDSPDGGSGMDTHYLTDVNGIGIPGVIYNCTSNSARTGSHGDYAFDTTGDRCTFTLDANFVNTDQGLYINSRPDSAVSGVDGIYYTCINYDTSANPRTGATVGKGHFNHVFNYDECTFRY